MTARREETAVAIVGAGAAGLSMASELRRAGVGEFVVFEQAADASPELRRILDRHHLSTHVRWRAEVAALDFDEEADEWTVRLADQRICRARVVLLACGPRVTDRHIAGVDGRTIENTRDTAAFLGLALHGFPNLFFLAPPDLAATHRLPQFPLEARTRYLRHCVDLLLRTSSTRIEVRAATQHEFDRRLRSGSYRPSLRHPYPHHFDLTVAADREPAHEYSGPAVLDAPGAEMPVTVTLNGHPDPIDGRYHWYGRVVAADGAELPDPGRGQVFLTLPGGAPAAGRLQERDPWGHLRIVGVGAPPFPLESAHG
ncbi:DUF4873 domain-containing protein [Nocardia transvalensis]|uniref:DUF4873 domain-containing protein n=1 Tax=Nocardia transvalensis TaxID=37333 RepID=UPI001895078C|nr:DUF4873 domain-containing protein [Nocardia transvalensis]MBF6331368.1 DUF4873 domain-containing protein [Nocardia transvalensis]